MNDEVLGNFLRDERNLSKLSKLKLQIPIIGSKKLGEILRQRKSRSLTGVIWTKLETMSNYSKLFYTYNCSSR
jgi:hypothetical protein